MGRARAPRRSFQQRVASAKKKMVDLDSDAEVDSDCETDCETEMSVSPPAKTSKQAPPPVKKKNKQRLARKSKQAASFKSQQSPPLAKKPVKKRKQAPPSQMRLPQQVAINAESAQLFEETSQPKAKKQRLSTTSKTQTSDEQVKRSVEPKKASRPPNGPDLDLACRIYLERTFPPVWNDQATKLFLAYLACAGSNYKLLVWKEERRFVDSIRTTLESTLRSLTFCKGAAQTETLQYERNSMAAPIANGIISFCRERAKVVELAEFFISQVDFDDDGDRSALVMFVTTLYESLHSQLFSSKTVQEGVAQFQKDDALSKVVARYTSPSPVF